MVLLRPMVKFIRPQRQPDAINAKVINGKKYAFDTDGKMLHGWVKDGERQTDDDAWKDAEYYWR